MSPSRLLHLTKNTRHMCILSNVLHKQQTIWKGWQWIAWGFQQQWQWKWSIPGNSHAVFTLFCVVSTTKKERLNDMKSLPRQKRQGSFNFFFIITYEELENIFISIFLSFIHNACSNQQRQTSFRCSFYVFFLLKKTTFKRCVYLCLCQHLVELSNWSLAFILVELVIVFTRCDCKRTTKKWKRVELELSCFVVYKHHNHKHWRVKLFFPFFLTSFVVHIFLFSTSIFGILPAKFWFFQSFFIRFKKRWRKR
jgi:hypothetical protein